MEKFTHSEATWLFTRGELPDNASSDRVITKEAIGNYFDNVKEKYNMINPNDIQSYTQMMFQQI